MIPKNEFSYLIYLIDRLTITTLLSNIHIFCTNFTLSTMEGNSRSISVDEEIKVSKLKVKAGTMLYDGRIILIYESLQQKDDEPKQKKLKSTEVGIVKKILVKEGDIVAPG